MHSENSTLLTLLSQCPYAYWQYVKTDLENFQNAYPKQFHPALKSINNFGNFHYQIELIGEFHIKKENKINHLNTNISFPIAYPNQAPTIQLLNPDQSIFSVHQKYSIFAKQDESSIIISFQELQNWSYHKSLALVIKKLFEEIDFQYPFILRQFQQQQQNKREQQNYQFQSVPPQKNQQQMIEKVVKQFKSEKGPNFNNNIINEEKICTICYENEREFIALPCGHFIYCKQCKDLVKDQCLMCRQPVQNMQKVYI